MNRDASHRSFRAAVVSSELVVGVFFDAVVITGNTIELLPVGRRQLVLSRDEVEAVEFERQWVPPFWVKTVVRFRFDDGAYASKVVVPLRTRALRAALSERGWPVAQVQLGSTEPRTVRPPPGRAKSKGMSTAGAVLTTALLAVGLGSFLWFWWNGALAVAEAPDWEPYVIAVLEGDEPTVRSLVCEKIRRDLGQGADGFAAARATTMRSFSSPPIRYEGLRRGGHMFTLEDSSTVFRAIPSVSEGAPQRTPCPTSSSALLGTTPQ